MSSTNPCGHGPDGKGYITGLCRGPCCDPSFGHMLSTPEPSNRHSTAPDEKRHTSPLTPLPTNEPPNPMRLHSFASFPQQTRSPSLQEADLNRAADYFRPSLSNDDVANFKDSPIEEYETPETSLSPFAQASQNLDGGPLGSGPIPKMTPTLRPPFSSETHPGFSSQLTTGPSLHQSSVGDHRFSLYASQQLTTESNLQQSSVGDDLPPPHTNYLPRKKQRNSEEPSSSQWTNEVFFDQESCSVSDNTIYQPLEGNELRYVVLKAGQPKAPIRITFVTSNFDQLGQYEALSYVWGESICGESIEVETGEGTVVRHTVTKNLGTALRYLRDGVNDRVLWIDALSINQSDLRERSRQVAKMHHIFHGASNVCIWLGDQADDSHAAMDFITQILDFSAHSKNITNKIKTRTLALSRLLARPWFSRRWVVQEMALAKKATVHCGTKSMPWSEFADAVALFGIIRDEVVRHMSPDQAYELGETHALGAASLVDISSNIYRKDHVNDRIQEHLLTLESLLAKLPMFNVSDARDAVYATIALGKDTFDQESIPVNYTMPPATLFAIVTKFVIEKSGSLDIICRPWAPAHGDLALPSWIPTVANYPFVRRPDGQYNRQNADILVGRPEHKHKPYNATGDVGANRHVRISFEPLILECGGIQADCIAEVGDRCVNGNIPVGWAKMAGWHDRSKPIPPEFWRTLVADRGPDGENPPHWYGRACRHVFERSGTDDLDTTKMTSAIQSTDIKGFLQRVQSVTWSRKFFLTKQHPARPGIGPAHCQVGDHICIFFGCSVPVVLRPCESKYRLIGECYVQGMMGGEALQASRASGDVRKNFQIL